VRAHRNPELRGEQQDRQVLVHAGHPAGVDLADPWIAWLASSCLKITRLATFSPVATRIGAMPLAISA